jgi:hypothetical protein
MYALGSKARYERLCAGSSGPRRFPAEHRRPRWNGGICLKPACQARFRPEDVRSVGCSEASSWSTIWAGCGS